MCGHPGVTSENLRCAVFLIKLSNNPETNLIKNPATIHLTLTGILQTVLFRHKRNRLKANQPAFERNRKKS